MDAMVPEVMKLIAGMAEEEVNMLLGVSSEITKLKDNTEGIKAFLADAERRRITEQSVQRWVNKLKDAIYDATDILDLCQLEVDERRESEGGSMDEKAPSCCQSMLFCLRNPVFAHDIGSRIKELNQRLDNIHKQAYPFKFNIDLGSNPEPSKLTDAERSMQKTTAEFDESAIVGEKIEHDTRELAQMLITSGSHDIKVLSIVGTSGIGKTTLAQKIFNDTSVQEYFKVKVWLSITQHFDEAEMLRTAIKHAGGQDHANEHDKTLLTRTLINTLSRGRFLLVLDDVWSVQAWSPVLSVPIRNAIQKQPGNWVLVTSRLENLVLQMGAACYLHRVRPLDDEDAWALLNKQLPLQPNNQVVRTDHLRDVGMKIIRKCGGLPLAVKVMGGLLSTKAQSEGDWEAVLHHRAWSVDGLPEELDKRIYLSYEDLSPQLKQCFLYCSLFPKGTSILQRQVVPMWISEGFIIIQPQGGSNSHDDQLEEIGTEYYKELITRNLIEPTEGDTITRYSCTMHDVVRSFAEYMSREDSLVVLDTQLTAGGSNGTSLVVRRMSMGPSKLVQEWAALQKQVSLRTLIMYCKINYKLGDSLTCFSRLRVLSIYGGDCDMLLGSLCQLRHLRYLSLKGTNASRLPEDIHNMKFLQHIALEDSWNLESLPSSIIKLVHLRTLELPGLNTRFLITKGFGGVTNLRTLFGFPVHMDMDGGWCSLEEIGPLSQLRKLTLHGLENVLASSLDEMARISSKEHLNYLQLYWSSREWMKLRDRIEKQHRQKAVEEVLEKLYPPTRIQHLHIQGYFGRMLPNWMMVPNAAIRAFKSLMYMVLQDLPCCTKLPDGLCQLPTLKLLKIVDAPAIKSAGFEFQASSSLTAVGGGVTAVTSAAFPNLIHLVLDGLCEWKEWDWEEQAIVDVTAGTMAMPALEYLTIKNCKLSCLPPGLANSKRHALRELYLRKLPNLTFVDNFPSVVELGVTDCPNLKRISRLSGCTRSGSSAARTWRCWKVSQHSIALAMESLPGYLQAVNPRYLSLSCNKKMYGSLSSPGSSEWNKISHIGKCDISYNE